MKLATTTGDFASYTSNQMECMEYISQSGFKYIDYNFGIDYAQRSGIYGNDFNNYIDSIKKQAEKLGVKLVQAHSPMGKPIADDNSDFLKDTAKSIEACGLLGIKNIVIHSGYAPNLTIEETFKRNKNLFFMPLLETAEKYGVNILIENFNKKSDIYWIDNAPDLLKMVEYINHPLCHAIWDAGHGNMQEMSQDESLRILGKEVYALHIQDNMGNHDSHTAPFFGTMNLDSLMHGLIDIGYNGYFTFEASNVLIPASKRRPYPNDERLKIAPIEIKLKMEGLLYEIGKSILSAYDCFEE